MIYELRDLTASTVSLCPNPCLSSTEVSAGQSGLTELLKMSKYLIFQLHQQRNHGCPRLCFFPTDNHPGLGLGLCCGLFSL